MGPEAVESLVRGHSFKAPSPPRAEGPQTWARTDLNTKSMADPGYTRTHTHQHMHSCSGKRPPKECQREGGILSVPGSGWGAGRGRQWPAMTVRDSWLFEEVVCCNGSAQTVTQCCSGSAQTDFLKGQLRRAGQGHPAHLPCQHGERSEGAVCPH